MIRGSRILLGVVWALCSGNLAIAVENGKETPICGTVFNLDGPGWQIATDAENVGREQKWPDAPRPEAKAVKIPSVIQVPFPGYHGAAWYWKNLTVPVHPLKQGRYVLKFWAVDYKADVWVNGDVVGGHENGETPFEVDITDAVKPGGENILAVRVLNPTDTPIDGIVLSESPHRNKVMNYAAGSSFNQGGIVDSVELILAPAVRITDVFARPDVQTGNIPLEVTVHNAVDKPVKGKFSFSVTPGGGGTALHVQTQERNLPPGDSVLSAELKVGQPRLWQLDDPCLYRIAAAVETESLNSADAYSLKCGFREFSFANGYFRLSGKRLFLKGSHTGNHFPVGISVPVDPDLVRRDLLNAKAMGFNLMRYIAGMPLRAQLDCADEIGMLVYNEAMSSWCMDYSEHFDERFDRAVREMILRDRNHASVVIWGLINENYNGAVMRHAVKTLGLVRSLDPTRMVLLGSGRWDNLQNSAAVLPSEIQGWGTGVGLNPCILFHSGDHTLEASGAVWEPGRLGIFPGLDRDDTALRWTAPAKGEYQITAVFTDISKTATTSDVAVFHNGKPLFQGNLNLKGQGKEQNFSGSCAMKQNDTIDFTVGYGELNWIQPYGMQGFLHDAVGLDAVIRSADGKEYNASRDFSLQNNPAGPWCYGVLQYLGKKKPSLFQLCEIHLQGAVKGIGALSNPGSAVWEDVLDDMHYYPHVPHDDEVMPLLRTGNVGRPVYMTEYGIGSGVNWLRLFSQYQQSGYPDVEDARFCKARRDDFLADYQRWNMAEAFGRPEEFFEQSLRQMAAQRILGISALRSNPRMVGHNITGTVDQGMTGEGVTATLFREPKPEIMETMFDLWSPLRWCTFAEPWSLYRGGEVKLEAVLSNEDVLRPGAYPVHLWIFGPDHRAVWERSMSVTIPDNTVSGEPPFAISIFREDVRMDVPAGRYQFVVSFESGAAATGGKTEFYVFDPADMPAVKREVVFWGDDPGLSKWMTAHGITVRPFDPSVTGKRELMLVGSKPAASGGAEAFAELAKRIARGSSAVFLSPSVFEKEKDSADWIPLIHKPVRVGPARWLYHADDWAKNHPIFEGLQSGGLLDPVYYRELIPNEVWSGGDLPAQAIAGMNDVSWRYASGLSLAVYTLGAGEFMLSTMPIHKKITYIPQAERLLRNLLNYAGRDLDKPPTELPADFDKTLKEMGYSE